MAETVRHGGASQGETDALVVFGITGDLAKKMTFVSLYRLERRKELRCRVVGVAIDDLSDDELRARARDAIEHADGTLDEQVFERLAERLTYVPGDYDDPATYTRLGKHLGEVGHTTFYLEIPPSLFERVVRGLHDAGLTENAVPPRLARTQTLGAYANEDGRVTAAAIERAKYDHETGTPRPAPAAPAAPMRFKPRRKS